LLLRPRPPQKCIKICTF